MVRFLHWKENRKSHGSLIPGSREGHTLTYIEHLNALLMFGGCSSQKNNQIYLYNLRSDEWERKQAKGTGPSPRCYHSSVFNKKLNAVVVVGGYTSQNISVSDIYFLLLESWHWKMFRSLESFPKRHHFSLVAMGDSELLIFGGLSRPAEGVLGDLWQIDLGSCMFTPEHESQRVVLRQLTAQGTKPSPRYSHQCCTIGISMFVFGGHLQHDTKVDQSIYKLDRQASCWSSFVPKIDPRIGCRALSVLIPLSSTELLVFGGVSTENTTSFQQTAILNLDSEIWSVPFVAGHRPQTRRYCSSAQTTSNSVMILGGLSDTYCSMQFLQLEVAENSSSDWQPIRQPSRVQQEALRVLGCSIVQNNQDLLTLEWAIREEHKAARQLHALESNIRINEVECEARRKEKREMADAAQKEREFRIQQHRLQELVMQDLLELERQRIENWKRALVVQQLFLVRQLETIQHLQQRASQAATTNQQMLLFNSRLQQILEMSQSD